MRNKRQRADSGANSWGANGFGNGQPWVQHISRSQQGAIDRGDRALWWAGTAVQFHREHRLFNNATRAELNVVLKRASSLSRRNEELQEKLNVSARESRKKAVEHSAELASKDREHAHQLAKVQTQHLADIRALEARYDDIAQERETEKERMLLAQVSCLESALLAAQAVTSNLETTVHVAVQTLLSQPSKQRSVALSAVCRLTMMGFPTPGNLEFRIR